MNSASCRSFRLLAAVALLLAAGPGCSRRASTDRLLASAAEHVAHEQFDRAEVELRRVLQLEAANGEAQRQLGLLYARQGRHARALPYLAETVRRGPADVTVQRSYAQVCLATGQVAEAATLAGALLDQLPHDGEAALLLAESALDPASIAAARLRLQAVPDGERQPHVLVARALLDLRQRDLAAAETKLRQAEALTPAAGVIAAGWASYFLAREDVVQADAALRAAAAAAAPRTPQRLQWARWKIQLGEFAAARAALELLQREAPDYLPVSLWLAELALVENRPEDCAALVERILARDPADTEARLLRGRLKLAQGHVDEAVAELEPLAQTQPSAPACYHLALAQLAQGASAKATGNLNRALQYAPGFVDAILVLAGQNIRNGAAAAAVMPLKQLIRDRPRLAAARLLLADAYRTLRAYDDARRVYEGLESDFAPNPQTHLAAGLLEVQQGRAAAAEQSFRRALDLAPDFTPALEQLVYVQLGTGQAADALARVDAALSRQPTAAALHVLRGQIRLAQGDTAGATAALGEAIRLQPGVGAAYYLLARAHVRAGDADRALAHLQDAIRQRPRDVPARLLAAEIHAQQRNFAAARAAYESALAIDRRSSLALNNLACLLVEHFDELEAAADYAKRARALRPTDPHIADTLGWVLLRQQQTARALALLEDSGARLAGSAEVQAHLGLARYLAAREEAARAALEQAIALNAGVSCRAEVDAALRVLQLEPARCGPAEIAMLRARVERLPNDAVALSRLGAALEHAGAGSEALGLYRRILREHPAHPVALPRLVERLRTSRDLTGAIELVKLARKEDADDPAILHLLGRLAYESGDVAWAANLLERTAREEPDDAGHQLDYALAAYALARMGAVATTLQRVETMGAPAGRGEEARLLRTLTDPPTELPPERLADARRLGPRDPGYLPARMALALDAERRRDAAEAMRLYESLLGRYPSALVVKQRLALLSARERRHDDAALAAADAAHEASPRDAAFTGALGVIQYERGHFGAAKELLRAAVAVRPGDGELLWFLGMAQHKSGEPAVARHTLEQALRCQLPAELAAEARALAQSE